MFYENLCVHDGDKTHGLCLHVSNSEPLPMVFQFWAAELARDVLRLGVYFQAVAIMLQIPGAAEYKWARDEAYDDEELPDPDQMFYAAHRNELLDVLAECLRRLGAEPLMKQVAPEERCGNKLSAEWRELLDRQEDVANGLLSVAAECLDSLIVKPGMREIEKDGEPHWWQRFRVEMH